MLTDDIIKSLSQKHKLPEEQVELILKSFFDGLRHYLSHPLESKGGVMIHDFITFKINQKRLIKQIARLEGKTFVNKHTSLNNNIEFHKELLENTYKYERQEKKSNINK